MPRILARALLSANLLLSSDCRGNVLAAAQATTPASRGLHSLLVASGKLYFGNSFDVNTFNDSAYQTIGNNKDEFGMITPENSQKWGPIQPTEGSFDFSNTDSVSSKVDANGQMFRCHALTWHSQLPAFVENGTWTPETLTLAIQSHITTVVTRYKSRCYAWDVVNEALDENGTFRPSVFFEVLGPAFLPISFLAAAAADPDARLYYNDFNLETNPLKADGAARIVGLIREGGARIDGLGFQSHLRVGQVPPQANLTATLQRFADLGLEVALSELDIAVNLTAVDLAVGEDGDGGGAAAAYEAALAQQATDYVTAVSACLAVEKCVGVTVWQFTDKYSWIPSTFPGLGDACLFSANFTKKPAYFAVENLLIAVAESVRAATTTGGGGGAGGGGGNSSSLLTSGATPNTIAGVGGIGRSSSIPGGTGSNDAATAALANDGPSIVSVLGGRGSSVGVLYWVLGVVAALLVF